MGVTAPASKLVHVALGERSYGVEVGVGLLTSLGERVRSALRSSQTGETPAPPGSERSLAESHGSESHATKAFLVVDDNLPDGFVAGAVGSLESAGFTVTSERVHATEPNKSLETVQRLLVALARTRHERGEPIVALGGGIVGDVAGFVGASYRRGVPVIQCPTTLLAMVDASVGGKTGVNLSVDGALLKNMAGAFWQPRLVLADITSLRSLGDRQFRAGLAECVKHGMIARDADPALLGWIESCLPSLQCRDEPTLVEFVARNVAVKARIVAGDEREESVGAGGRALLNLGHTFAHAIETIDHLSPDDDPAKAPLLHGEAVALGLIASCAAAAACGLVDAVFVDRIGAILADAGLPTEVAGLPGDEDILASMRHDKKVTGGRVRLALPIGEGAARIEEGAGDEAVTAGITAIRAPG